jgi:cytochrome c
MDITPEGVMYVLEYGTVYGADNDDARLVRVDYNAGNRTPVAKINVDDSIGLAPLKVSFNSNNSFDYDEDDQLKYEWTFEGNKVGSTEANPTYTFNSKGVYKVTLKVTDPSGLSSVDAIEIKAGNTIPEVAISTTDNSSFYFGNGTLDYAVDVKDKEEATIDPKKIQVKLEYIPIDAGTWKTVNGRKVLNSPGKTLIQAGDCKACHQVDKSVLGPAFMDVSKRYESKPDIISQLANKIITGGTGVWGNTHYMTAHPQLSKENAATIVKYILSLKEEKTVDSLPAKGSVSIAPPAGKQGGSFVLSAAYTDNGNGVVPLSGMQQLLLNAPTIQAQDADKISGMERYNNKLGAATGGAYFVFKGVDLKGIKQVIYNYASKDNAAVIEIHADSLKGAVISTLNYQPTGDWNKFKQATATVTDTGGKHDLYFVFKKEGTVVGQGLCLLDWVRFGK